MSSPDRSPRLNDRNDQDYRNDQNHHIELGSTAFALIVATLFVVFYNASFFESLLAATNVSPIRAFLFIANNALLLFALTFLVITLITVPRIGKPLLAIVFFVAAGVAYFMHTYGIVIHARMIQNTIETDVAEARDLLSPTLIGYLIVLGAVPALALLRVKIRFGTLRAELVRKLKHLAVALLAAVALLGSMHSDYIAFFRNHKEVRQQANPLNFIYAGFAYAGTQQKTTTVAPIGTDAGVTAFGHIQEKPTLLILVVGETARADHFGINGYTRQTTPRLAQEDIVNFTQVTSCGTETAVSVPCMFSNMGHAHYSDSRAKSQESLLDVVSHAGIATLWRDNNSGCKGACARTPSEKVKEVPIYCKDGECFDEALLQDLDARLDPQGRSMLLVLHQKGSHGPDYFHRYPPSMQQYAPVCQRNELHECSQDSLINAYDNTILYTDHFLGQAIDWLKTKSDRYNTALVYLSDHGESLGENGLYLHGMPYMIAPETQKHVPMIMWLSDAYKRDNAIDTTCLQSVSTQSYSHDNLFPTVLGMLNVNTDVYDPKGDIVGGCRSQQQLAVRLRQAQHAAKG